MRSFAICLLLVVTAYCCFGLPATPSQQNRFAVDFFKHAYKARQNAIMAPIAIQAGLAMMHSVTTPEAGRTLRNGLYLPESESEVIKETKAAMSRINERSDSLEMLSRVYLPNKPLNPELVPHLRDNFGTGSEIVDFADQRRVVDRVNTWVNDSSRGTIPELLQVGELSDEATSLLINVMVMNASWNFFDEKRTVKKTFHFLNGDHEVDMMMMEYGRLPQMYLEDLETDAIKLPYAPGTDLSMIILLPEKGVNLQHVIKHFNIGHYNQLIELDVENRWFGTIQLRVPRFKIEQKLDARPALKKMGLGPLFGQEGFQVLANRLSKLGLVKQSAFIKVDERGTKAAASAGITSWLASGPWIADVDRPFMFIIRNESTKDILFIGHYSNYRE